MTSFAEYSDVFFWNYKRMDNANYNFLVLELICSAKKDQGNDILFNKPIILIIMSIVECILFDFIKRVNEHSNEVIPDLNQSAIEKIKSKTLEKLHHIVDQARKHNLLLSDSLYFDLDDLRSRRNRIHIQNDGQFDKNEYKIWTNAAVQKAGEALENICQVLCYTYPRPQKVVPPMIDFPRPWLPST